jgi:hypothetical protein
MTGSGNGSPTAPGRVVQLQVEKAGLWYTVATTHEGTGGKFSFTIKGTMTSKAAFSPGEWQVVLEGPPAAGMIVLTAAHGGTFRETVAMSKEYVEARPAWRQRAPR